MESDMACQAQGCGRTGATTGGMGSVRLLCTAAAPTPHPISARQRLSGSDDGATPPRRCIASFSDIAWRPTATTHQHQLSWFSWFSRDSLATDVKGYARVVRAERVSAAPPVPPPPTLPTPAQPAAAATAPARQPVAGSSHEPRPQQRARGFPRRWRPCRHAWRRATRRRTAASPLPGLWHSVVSR